MDIYNKEKIYERHRHRYEFNPEYEELLKDNGMVVSGKNSERNLVETVEIKDHPWFFGCQFHPEFKSRPMEPHPLFVSFIKAAKENSR
jgi:CTP synthase